MHIYIDASPSCVSRYACRPRAHRQGTCAPPVTNDIHSSVYHLDLPPVFFSISLSPHLSLSVSVSLTLKQEGTTSKENIQTALLPQQASEVRGESGQAGERGVGPPRIATGNLIVSSSDKRTKSTWVLLLLISAIDQDSRWSTLCCAPTDFDLRGGVFLH